MVVLGSLVSFYISLLRSKVTLAVEGSENITMEKWEATAILAGIHQDWVAFVRDSPLADFKRERRGAFIDYRKTEFSVLVPYFVAAGIPVVLRIQRKYIDKGVDPRLEARLLRAFHSIGVQQFTVEIMNVALRRYIPPADVIDRVLNPSNSVDLSMDDDGINTDPVPIDPLPAAPPTNLAMETREQFFARRGQQRDAYLLSETEEQRKRRLSREESFKSAQVPGKGNRHTKVFVWVKEGNSEFREPVDRNDFDLVWDQYSRVGDQKFYDSVNDEWHLWSTSSRGQLQPPRDDDDDDDWDGLGYTMSVVAIGEDEEICNDVEGTLVREERDGTIRIRQDDGRDVFREDLEGLYGFSFDKSDDHYVDAFFIAKDYPLEAWMADWLGFRLRPYSQQDQVEIHPGLKSDDRLLNCVRDSLLPSEKDHIEPIRQFIGSLAAKIENPGHFSDLNGSHISTFGNPAIRVLSSSYAARLFNNDSHSPLEYLYSVELLDKAGNVERDHSGRRFFVWNAVTALAIKRRLQFAPSYGHIAEVLLQSGVAFIMACPKNRLRQPVAERPVCGFAPRPVERAFDALDFQTYCAQCRALLSKDRLRKFLRIGGIVWRIVCMFLELDDGLDGPSSNALYHYQELEGSENSVRLYDDGISSAEMDILLGTVYFFDGKLTPPRWHRY